ncbi:Ankyrin repeat-containing domain protein, partial [Metarhizium majus ARSEF 297]
MRCHEHAVTTRGQENNARGTDVLDLVDKGAKVDSKDDQGHTPLSRAAAFGGAAVVKLLLEKFADIEAKDNSGRTPLSWAAANGHEAVIKLEAKDNSGRTPLSWAIEKGRDTMVLLLLSHYETQC